ncbi:MAG: type IV pilus modification PilV family protein [Desulfocucumaceae bacterium]
MRFLKGNRGFTYLEVIVAMSILVIVLGFTAKLTVFSARADRSNTESTRMALLAQGIMEMVKAGESTPSPFEGYDYSITTSIPDSLGISTVEVKISSNNPGVVEDFTLVSYTYEMPGVSPPPIPAFSFEHGEWFYTGNWDIDESGITHHSSDPNIMYYKTAFSDYKYIVNLNYSNTHGNGGGFAGGAIFGPTKNYWFWMDKGDDGKVKVNLSINGNTTALTIPSAITFQYGVDYRLEVIDTDNTLTLLINGQQVYSQSTGWITSTPDYLGLKDLSGSGTGITYTFPTS